MNGHSIHSVNGHGSFSPELSILEALLSDPAPARMSINRWMQRHLSKKGLLIADPWRTPDAAALLAGVLMNGDAAFARRFERLALAAAKLSAVKIAAPVKGKSFGFVDSQSQSAVLRRGTAPDSAMLAVDFRNSDCRIALRIGGETVADGVYATSLGKNGQEVVLRSPWEIVCESADSDMEYLELATPLDANAFLDRHLFIARKAPIVWMIDVLRGDERAEWRWKVRWDGARPNGLRGEATHRGQRLLGLQAPAALLPVSSPPDPFSKGGMRVAMAEGAFEFSQAETAKRLVAATAWVWSESGVLSLPPWRRLTVTQDGRMTPPEEAFAFRVQAGARQCVFFRALEHPRRHAFLGCQTFDETIIGELDRKGDVKPWMRIE